MKNRTKTQLMVTTMIMRRYKDEEQKADALDVNGNA